MRGGAVFILNPHPQVFFFYSYRVAGLNFLLKICQNFITWVDTVAQGKHRVKCRHDLLLNQCSCSIFITSDDDRTGSGDWFDIPAFQQLTGRDWNSFLFSNFHLFLSSLEINIIVSSKVTVIKLVLKKFHSHIVSIKLSYHVMSHD